MNTTLGKSAYLVFYNACQGVGWLACLNRLALSLAEGKAAPAVFQDVALFVSVFQAASLLEALHAAVGVVRSDPVMALMQWTGRSHVLFFILQGVQEVQTSPFGPLMIAVWAMAEVVRYPWYALTTLGHCPGWLTWLRYTLFIPLYPIGVISEMMLLWLALPVLEKDGRWSLRLPNAFNFGFEYSVFIKVVLLLYPFLWWKLYSTLLGQRAKKLAASPTSSSKTHKLE